MEHYPVYKKPLKSGGAPLPNDTESNYRMFQHPFHRKGSVSRATHQAYDTHLVHITISCCSTVEPRLSLPRLFDVFCEWWPCPCINKGERNMQKEHLHANMSLFLFPWPGVMSDFLLLLWPFAVKTEIKYKKGRKDSLSCHFGAIRELSRYRWALPPFASQRTKLLLNVTKGQEIPQ